MTCLTALVSVSKVSCRWTHLSCRRTALESEGTALVSEDTALVSEDTALVSEDTALVSENTVLVFEDTALVAIPFRVCKLAKRRSKRFCAEDRGFLSEVVQFPFGFASWRKGDPNVSVRRIKASFRKRGNSLSGNLRSAPGVHQECTRSAPGVPRSAPGVHQKCTRSAPECTRSALGVHQEFTRNAPGVLGTFLVFSAVLCCS